MLTNYNESRLINQSKQVNQACDLTHAKTEKPLKKTPCSSKTTGAENIKNQSQLVDEMYTTTIWEL